MNIQKYCEILEALVEKEISAGRLTPEEFGALNQVLLYAQVKGAYVLKEKVVH